MKFQKLAQNSARAWHANNFGAKGVTSRKLSTWRATRHAWEFRYGFWGICIPKIGKNV